MADLEGFLLQSKTPKRITICQSSCLTTWDRATGCSTITLRGSKGTRASLSLRIRSKRYSTRSSLSRGTLFPSTSRTLCIVFAMLSKINFLITPCPSLRGNLKPPPLNLSTSSPTKNLASKFYSQLACLTSQLAGLDAGAVTLSPAINSCFSIHTSTKSPSYSLPLHSGMEWSRISSTMETILATTAETHAGGLSEASKSMLARPTITKFSRKK